MGLIFGTRYKLDNYRSTFEHTHNFGVSRRSAFESDKEGPRDRSKNDKISLLRITKGVPEEVLEDPNEQTHSEFQTKRTGQGRTPKEKRTISTIKENKQIDDYAIKVSALPGNPVTKPHNSPPNPKAVLPKRKGSNKPNISLDTKPVNLSTIEQIARFPESKSISLSFSSKYPEEEDVVSAHGPGQSNKIIERMNVSFDCCVMFGFYDFKNVNNN